MVIPENPFDQQYALPAQQPGTVLLGRVSLDDMLSPGTSHEQADLSGIETAARQASNQIVGVAIENADLATLTFPSCGDQAIIQAVLNKFENSPLALGWGNSQPNVLQAWQLFMHHASADIRTSKGIDQRELLPIRIELPDWLQAAHDFDILAGARLLDVTLIGDINGTLARDVKYCRVQVEGSLSKFANIGTRAERSTFTLKGAVRTDLSFQNASNIDVTIEGDHSGTIGKVTTSRVHVLGTSNGVCSIAGVCDIQGVRQNSGTAF